jgi:hypothetical protein
MTHWDLIFYKVSSRDVSFNKQILFTTYNLKRNLKDGKFEFMYYLYKECSQPWSRNAQHACVKPSYYDQENIHCLSVLCEAPSRTAVLSHTVRMHLDNIHIDCCRITHLCESDQRNMKDEVQSLAELLPTVKAVLMGSKQRFHFRL